MFKFLKDRLKSWTKKLSKEAEVVETEKQPAIKEIKKAAKLKKEIKVPLKLDYPLIAADTEYLEREVEKLRREPEIPSEKALEKQPSPGEEGFFKKIISKIKKIKISEEVFETYAEELEMLLLENNVAVEVAEKIITELKEKIVGKELLRKEVEEEIKDSFKEIIKEILVEPFDLAEKIKEKMADQSKRPYVILFCGINGTGKTTTLAKVADALQKQNISCVLAAADTFRAASIEQIKKYGEKIGVRVISQEYGSDPAAVGFDAIRYAEKNFINCVLIDTAGRMHTSKNLMAQIEKIARVCKPDAKIFVGESLTGNDVVEQVKNFNWAVGIDGIILTKADIDEKGGTALSVGYITKKPILYLGTGQEMDAIEPFDKKKFIERLGL